ncbi:MAG: penicillin acylase family protein [Azospirillaceae bacterium]|nr:penicillin acylase family protein [Azospirillaceae bacterium]
MLGSGMLALYLAGSDRWPRRARRPPDLAERLSMLPCRGIPVSAAVSVSWDEHQIPFIDADHDRDLAVVLGMVHAHLRLSQMEILRALATGQVAALIGPLGIAVDRALRTIDFGRAVPAIGAGLPAATRDWLDGFVTGINHYVARATALPPDFRVLGLRRQPWTVADVLTVGRLAAADVSWLAWLRLASGHDRPGGPAWWRRLMDQATPPVSHLAGGSNSMAVAAAHSSSGGALIASDPHLGLTVPNPWLIAGCRSPSYHMVGLMIPALPFVAIGRNPWIAWGGTSLHAASSDLFDVSDLPAERIARRRVRLQVRWAPAQTVTIRETSYGPIISDALRQRDAGRRTLALRWAGHQPSDEMSAFLALNRARSWEDYRQAMAGIAVPGQNMIVATATGRVGQAIAAHLPRRPLMVPADLVAPPEALASWNRLVTAADLPWQVDPESGFVASANNPPPPAVVPIGFLFSPEDRIRRLRTLLAGPAPLSADDLVAIQQDVHADRALALRDVMLAALGPPERRWRRFLDALAGWDGNYDAASAGALAFELLLQAFATAFFPADRLAAYGTAWAGWALMAQDITAADPAAVAAVLRRVLSAVALRHAGFGSWGAIHRLRLAHPLAAIPGAGRRWRFRDLPAAGSSETLHKTAHGLVSGRHRASYGACARHVSDLADLDDNRFVLLGGQDGWVGSTTHLDQVALWQQGAMIRVPLRPETVRTGFARHVIVMTP